MGFLTVGGTLMASETTNVFIFVYGSLRPDGWNHRLIEQYVRRAVPATAKGILVDLGSFPAMVAGDGIIRGVLLEVDPGALAITDRLEGVPHFYRRVQTIVTLDDGNIVKAWGYEHAEPSRVLNHPRLLVGHENGEDVYAWYPRR